MRVVKVLAQLVLVFILLTLGVSITSALAAALFKSRGLDDAAPEDDDLELSVVYDGRDFRSLATSFRGGRAVCWYAGLELDLRAARLDPAGGDLEVWTVFGGTRVRVPEDWAVEVRGVSLFGGAMAATTAAEALEASAPVLRVRHRTLFGGLNVVAAPDDEVVAV